MSQLQMFREQPRCPGCGSLDLRTEDVATGRHQCNRCGWRCRIGQNGKASDWLKIGRPTRRRYSRNYPKTAKTPCKANLTHT